MLRDGWFLLRWGVRILLRRKAEPYMPNGTDYDRAEYDLYHNSNQWGR